MGGTYTEARHACFTAVDFETTGSVDGYPVEPWQIGMVKINRGRIRADERFESLLRVGERPFNPRAPGRHADLRAEIAAAPTVNDLWPELLVWVRGCPMAAHNVGTERGVLTRAAPLHRIGPWVDTLALTRRAYPALESKALEDVTRELRLDAYLSSLCPGRGPHDALYDAFACAALLEHLLSLPGWEHVTVEALSGR